jgi:hypothetical protein
MARVEKGSHEEAGKRGGASKPREPLRTLIVLLLQSLEDLEVERVKGVGSTRTNINYHLLEVLVFFWVLVQTNTKITPMHGSFLLVLC